jgi:hypothetical protein
MADFKDTLTFNRKLCGDLFLEVNVKYTICLDRGDEEASVEDIDVKVTSSIHKEKYNFINQLSETMKEDIEAQSQELVDTKFEQLKREVA